MIATAIRPEGAHARIFRVLVERLRADPDLKLAVRTWTVPGDRGYETPETVAEIPRIRLTPLTPPPLSVTRAIENRRLNVGIEAVVSGGDVAGALSLGEMFSEAVLAQDRPASDALRAALKRVGGRTIRILEPVSPNHPDDYGQVLIRSRGRLEIDVYYSTR